jgi:hypothetical protein
VRKTQFALFTLFFLQVQEEGNGDEENPMFDEIQRSQATDFSRQLANILPCSLFNYPLRMKRKSGVPACVPSIWHPKSREGLTGQELELLQQQTNGRTDFLRSAEVVLSVSTGRA